jgi:phosphatidylglycerophosphate synthase
LEILRGARPHGDSKLLARDPSQLDMNFWRSLRKRETPYAMIVTAESKSAVEWRMFMGTYKGATDLVTKHLWPIPAFHATRFLAPLGITPNMVTTISAILTALAFWFFLEGQFILGLLTAWTMTFLDTVDGKLARTTLTSSKWGNVFDHGIDLVHPPFWYVAWGFGLLATGTQWNNEMFWSVIAAILGGYVLQRAIEAIAVRWLGLEIHIWRSIDTLFRQVTARRNPNLILLTLFTALGKPDWGLLAVALWIVICLGLHAFQIFQAFRAKGNASSLTSWMT